MRSVGNVFLASSSYLSPDRHESPAQYWRWKRSSLRSAGRAKDCAFYSPVVAV